MRRAPWPVGLAFGLALALVVVLAGPLLLFNPWFVSGLQARHEVAPGLGSPMTEVDRVTGALLADLFTGGDFSVPLRGDVPLLDARERSHMDDVSRLVRLLAILLALAAATLVVTAVLLRRERRRLGRLTLLAAGAVGMTGALLALVFAVAFEPAFLAFHAVFFPPGTFLFGPGSQLIRLFPAAFWFDASLVAGGTIVLAAVLVSLVGWRLWRRG